MNTKNFWGGRGYWVVDVNGVATGDTFKRLENAKRSVASIKGVVSVNGRPQQTKTKPSGRISRSA